MSQFPEEPLNLSADDGYGYFPAYPGQKLDDRYDIVRKLGYGPRSSVWLALSPKDDDIYYAVKILTVHASRQDPVYELDSLTAQENKFITFHESFTVSSTHGEHMCIVIDVTGPSLQDIQRLSPKNVLEMQVIQKACASILETLDELHAAGLIHGGITPMNMVLMISPLKEALDDDLRKMPDCRVERMVTIDGVDYPIVRSSHLPPWAEWNSSRGHINRQIIQLISYGHAQSSEGMATWEKSRMDNSLRPPECIIGSPYSYSKGVDIWMLGCAAYQMLTGHPLVPDDKMKDDQTMLAWLVAMSGQPAEAIKGIKSESNYFDDKGNFILDISKEILKNRISSTTSLSDAREITEVVNFIQRCLTLDPDHRPSANELMEDEWVLPGYEG